MTGSRKARAGSDRVHRGTPELRSLCGTLEADVKQIAPPHPHAPSLFPQPLNQTPAATSSSTAELGLGLARQREMAPHRQSVGGPTSLAPVLRKGTEERRTR